MPHRHEILRLAERHRVAVALGQADQTVRRAVDEARAEIVAVDALHRQQLADRDRDRAGLGGKPDQLALEIGVALDLGLRDQAVDRIVELGDDGDGVGAVERGLHQERRRDVADVGGAVVQRVDHLGAAAGHRHHVEIEALAQKEAAAARRAASAARRCCAAPNRPGRNADGWAERRSSRRRSAR